MRAMGAQGKRKQWSDKEIAIMCKILREEGTVIKSISRISHAVK